eukprot:TRINITY_DN15791_c0_g1_i1.p2 TRINITY_DN15791_c0_g1~~TRINITY_DN15791_c0_g1_i1.p2  ORF type:complete len:408 (+),score=104.88 TRINITY_DN15791_c0_g1_i1:100-1224(+)
MAALLGSAPAGSGAGGARMGAAALAPLAAVAAAAAAVGAIAGTLLERRRAGRSGSCAGAAAAGAAAVAELPRDVLAPEAARDAAEGGGAGATSADGGGGARGSARAAKRYGAEARRAVRREVICMDAVAWLGQPGVVPASSLILTSLPDASEVQEFAPTLEAWEAWFVDATRSVLRATPPGGLAVFYQTDIRVAGRGQISKASLVLRAAAEVEGATLLWHKIVHFGNVDQPSHTSMLVKFTHFLCFQNRRSHDGSILEDSAAENFGGMIPDVLARGEKPWGLKNSTRCMGIGATQAVLKAVVRRLPRIDTVVDPFCGAGTVLAVGNALGLHAIGVDISPKRAKQAQALDGPTLLAGRQADDSRPPRGGSRQEAS